MSVHHLLMAEEEVQRAPIAKVSAQVAKISNEGQWSWQRSWQRRLAGRERPSSRLLDARRALLFGCHGLKPCVLQHGDGIARVVGGMVAVSTAQA